MFETLMYKFGRVKREVRPDKQELTDTKYRIWYEEKIFAECDRIIKQDRDSWGVHQAHIERRRAVDTLAELKRLKEKLEDAIKREDERQAVVRLEETRRENRLAFMRKHSPSWRVHKEVNGHFPDEEPPELPPGYSR